MEYYWNDDDSTKKYSDEFSVKVPSEEGKNYLYVRAKDDDGNKSDYEIVAIFETPPQMSVGDDVLCEDEASLCIRRYKNVKEGLFQWKQEYLKIQQKI